MRKICVVGLGYIGLPTSAVLASHGFSVAGVDVNPRVVDKINQGLIHIVEPGLQELVAETVANGNLTAYLVPQAADVFIITVPTPITTNRRADMGLVFESLSQLASLVQPGNLIILESTSLPGTTRLLEERLLELRTDLTAGQVAIAHAPERVLPGNILEEIVNNDRIIGGLNEAATRKAASLYRSFVTGDVLETSAETAEFTKLAENTYRDINIAYANELSIITDQLGIDVWELISLANRHPRVNIMQPGPGVGGHCIAVDPWFIVDSATDGAPLIETARKVNDAKPDWVLKKIQGEIDGSIQHVVFLGLSFKANVDDLRESPSIEIVTSFAQKNPAITVLVNEPHIQVLPDELKHENIHFIQDFKSVIADASTKALLVLLVDHHAYREIPINHLVPHRVIDTRGFFNQR